MVDAMAAADPCLEEWEEWKSEMERSRRTRWREWVNRWPEVQVSDGAEEEEEEEEEVSEDEEETEGGEVGGEEEMEMRGAQGVDVGGGRRVTEISDGGEEDEEEEGERETIKEDEEKDSGINEVTGIEEARGIGGNEDGEEEEEGEGEEEGEAKDMEEDAENEVGREVKGDEETDEEKEEEEKVEELEEEEGKDAEIKSGGEEDEEEEGEEEEERETMKEDGEEDRDINEVTEIEEAQGIGGNEDGEEEEEEVSEDKKSEEVGVGKEEEEAEMEMWEAQEMDGGEGRSVTEIRNGDEVDEEEEGEEEEERETMKEDEEEDSDINEVTEIEAAQEIGGNEDGEEEEEGESAENGEEEGSEDKESDEGGVGKEEEEAEMEMWEAQEMDGGEGRSVTEIRNGDEVDEEEEGEEEGEAKDMEEDAENEVGREVKGDEETDEEKEEEEKVEELEEEEGKDAERNVNKAIVEDEGEESGIKEPKKMEEARENGEMELGLEVREKHDEQEEQEEREQIGQHYLAEQFREQMRRTVDENIHQNQGSTRREDKTVNEDANVPELVEFNGRDCALARSEDECCDVERIMNEGRDEGAWTSQEEEHESEKLTGEEGKGAESPTTQDERRQDELHDEDEDSTEYEEADEDVDNYDEEEVVKIYRKDDYLAGLFGTLKTFRDASLLTDLTLSTEDGEIFHVHSLVMAAVSLHVRESLSGGGAVDARADEEEDGGIRVHKRSVTLGPEVDRVGLGAVVEFAYTGVMSRLNSDTLHQIKAAAETLRAPRVLERCTMAEERSMTGEQRKDNGTSAEEQLTTSLRIIEQLWRDRVGCDVILEALGGSLHVHRVILAVWSDYFRSMFTLGMRESNQPCVTLPFLLASELEVLIGCSYSGALPLSWKCVFEITSTSLQLQYEPTLSLGLKFLQQEINPHSCLDVASFAEAYEMAQLLEVADDFVLHQFQKVARTSKFKDLPVNKLRMYLNSQSLCVSSELVVFKAVAAWILANPKKRLKHAQEMMKTVHFTLMTFREFKEVQTQNMWFDHSLAELFGEIYENFCTDETVPQSQCRIYLPKESLVLIGGDETSEDLSNRSISRELWFGNSLRNHTGIKKAVEWRRLGEMPDAPRFSHEVAVLRGQLYVFGGKNYYGTYDTLSSVHRYDPLHDSWEGLAAMQENRCSFSVVVLDGMIYAIGGHRDPDYLETVEQYSPSTNSWRYTCPLGLPQRAHVAKVLQGKIYVSGGMISDSQCLPYMFQYHPETGSTYLADMAKPRANHCMEVMGDCFYVAGGITACDVIRIVDLLSCEVYSLAANSWTAFASLPVPHVGAGSAVLEGKFYVLGGYSHEEYSDTKIVHRYDAAMQRWENMGKMPGPNNDIRACLLCLPPHLRL